MTTRQCKTVTTGHVAEVALRRFGSSRTIRVLIMDFWCYTPYYDRYLCEGLVEEAIDVTLGAVDYYKQVDYFDDFSVRRDPGLLDLVPRLGIRSQSVRRLLMLFESWLNMAAYSIRFRASRPDIIHVQWTPAIKMFPFELWFLRFARRLGIKLVYTVHNVLPMNTGNKYRDTYRQLYSEMDGLICHNEEAHKRLIEEFRLDPDRISVIPHGPLFHDKATSSGEDGRARLGFPQDECIILCQGILSPYKGIDFLLDTWHILAREGLKARLVIAGAGEKDQLEAARAQVAKLGLDQSVTLHLNFIPAEDLPTYYQVADILVYPYREITTSGALMTGLSFGKAVVTTGLPSFLELLTDGETAMVVEYGDTSSFANTLRLLIGNPAERKRLGSNAATLARSFVSWTDIACLTRDCYLKILGGAIDSGASSESGSSLAREADRIVP